MCGVKVSAPFSGVKGDFCFDFPADNFEPEDDLLGGPPEVEEEGIIDGIISWF